MGFLFLQCLFDNPGRDHYESLALINHHYLSISDQISPFDGFPRLRRSHQGHAKLNLAARMKKEFTDAS